MKLVQAPMAWMNIKSSLNKFPKIFPRTVAPNETLSHFNSLI